MCGIAGIFSRRIDEAADVHVKSMMDAQSHRGPDGSGVAAILSNHTRLTFGHRRLAILDLSDAASQPMFTADRKTAIVYNGEIYNFRSIRAELQQAGIQFSNNSDTEVLLYGYRQWGMERLLSKLRGMFAFVLYDERTSHPELFLVRDRFGIKPLYYIEERDRVCFASESHVLLSALHQPEMNIHSLALFLVFGSVPAPQTIWKNVESVMPAQYIHVSEDSSGLKYRKATYWTPENAAHGDQSIEELFRESVQLHMVSDVPVGVFLSGGLDSSAVAALAVQSSPLRTIHVRFNEQEYDESRYAEEVANHLKTEYSPITVTEKDFRDELPRILSVFDQPTVDGINTYFVSAAAKKAGLKVVLSGLGADEVFLGYPYYKKLAANEFALSAFLKQPRAVRSGALYAITAFQNFRGQSSWRRLEYLQSVHPFSIYAAIRGVFSNNEIRNLTGIPKSEFMTLMDHAAEKLSENNASEPLVTQINNLDFQLYLANQLLRDSDVLSMCHSVELRVPYLDHVLVERLRSIPYDQKIDSRVNKHLLVDAVSGLLPENTWKRKKMGFAFPLNSWFKNSLNQIRDHILSAGLFESGETHKVLSEFNEGKAHWSKVMALMTAATASNRLSNGHIASCS